MKFSIIIPVRAITAFLKESIGHLQELDYANFEVIILLDSDESFDFGGDTRFKLIAVGAKGPGEKRNLGARAAAGDILVFLDDDAYPAADWLTHAAQIFEDHNIYALGGPACTPPNVPFLETATGNVLASYLTSAGTVYRHIPQKARSVDDYPTVNLFVRKDAFLAVEGFTTEFWPGEDTKLCLDLVKEFKKPFSYDPKPIVYHHRRFLFRPHLKQISRYGMHRGQFARIFPETSRRLSYFIPSFFVLGLFLGPVFSYFFPILWYVYFGVLACYGALLLSEFFSGRGLKMGAYVALGIFLTHLVYGYYFIVGFIRRPHLKLKKFDAKTGDYIEG